MKELFGVNLTQNKKNTLCDGEEVVTRRADEAMRIKKEALNEEMNKETQKMRLPGFLGFVRIVALVAGVLATAAALFFDDKIRYFAGGAGAALCLIAALLTIYEKVRASSYKRTMKTTGLEDISSAWTEEAARQMGATSNVKRLDTFIYTYKNVKGQNEVLDGATVVNAPMYAFVDQDKFCIFDGEKRYDILLSAFKRVERVEDKLTAFGWNRSDKFREEMYPYKKFKIKSDERSAELTYKFHYKLVFIAANSEYCLRVPPYEAETVQSLTGLICPEK